jgi:hypothetical protein
MDIEDLVYAAGKKGRDKNGKSLKDVRKDAVQSARTAAHVKSILEGTDHSLLTKCQDPKLLAKNRSKEALRSATASVNLMEDYTGVSPSDIANFRGANPLTEDFAVEVLETIAFDDEKRATAAAAAASPSKRNKNGKKGKEKKPVHGTIDFDSNLVSVPAASALSSTVTDQPAPRDFLQRRKSFDELNYLYRAQIVKSQQKRPETRQQRLRAEAMRKRMARPVDDGDVEERGGRQIANSSSRGASVDDGTGTTPSKRRMENGSSDSKDASSGSGSNTMSMVERVAEERRRWRLAEDPLDKKRREQKLHESLVRMFELQARLEEERGGSGGNKKQQQQQGKAKGGSRSEFLSMFRRSSAVPEKAPSQSQSQTQSQQRNNTVGDVQVTRKKSNVAHMLTGGAGAAKSSSSSSSSKKKRSFFDSLPRLF